MGRVKAKGKKPCVPNQDDSGSGEEEKIHEQKKRGRPQKSLKDEMDEEEVEIIEDENSEESAEMLNNDVKIKSLTQNTKKRKINAQMKEKVDSVKEENEKGMSSNMQGLNKSNGFHLSGSRRKSKPHRAAEAVVECN